MSDTSTSFSFLLSPPLLSSTSLSFSPPHSERFFSTLPLLLSFSPCIHSHFPHLFLHLSSLHRHSATLSSRVQSGNSPNSSTCHKSNETYTLYIFEIDLNLSLVELLITYRRGWKAIWKATIYLLSFLLSLFTVQRFKFVWLEWMLHTVFIS